MNDSMWKPTQAFLDWLDTLPPTQKVMARRAAQVKAERADNEQKRLDDIIAKRERIAADKAAKKAANWQTKRGRKAKTQEVYPNSRVHLMEDDEDDHGKRKPASANEHTPVE
jgi:hypothetical protein